MERKNKWKETSNPQVVEDIKGTSQNFENLYRKLDELLLLACSLPYNCFGANPTKIRFHLVSNF